MPYDASLDQCVFNKSYEGETGRVNVSVYAYNKGQKKLQITRENRDTEGGFRFAKLGRMTKEEVEAIAPFIQEALSKMD